MNRAAYHAEWYVEHRESQNAKRKALRDANPEKHRTAGRIYYSKNKEKVTARSKAWRIANPERDKALKRAHYLLSKTNPSNRVRRLNRHLLNRYGLTVSERDAMLVEQGNKCAICLTATPGYKGWHVDHNHETGAVRGMLCNACNVGLGHFRDDSNLLRNALEYLFRFEGK